jgi:hypothetical protein
MLKLLRKLIVLVFFSIAAVFLGGVLTGFAGDVDDSLAWLARRMVDGELWFGARGFSFASLIVVGGLVRGHCGLEEL